MWISVWRCVNKISRSRSLHIHKKVLGITFFNILFDNRDFLSHLLVFWNYPQKNSHFDIAISHDGTIQRNNESIIESLLTTAPMVGHSYSTKLQTSYKRVLLYGDEFPNSKYSRYHELWHIMSIFGPNCINYYWKHCLVVVPFSWSKPFHPQMGCCGHLALSWMLMLYLHSGALDIVAYPLFITRKGKESNVFRKQRHLCRVCFSMIWYSFI